MPGNEFDNPLDENHHPHCIKMGKSDAYLSSVNKENANRVQSQPQERIHPQWPLD